MKLYPSFDQDKLILVGHGVFPWLYKEKWTLAQQLVFEKKQFGNKNTATLPKNTLECSFENSQLRVMNRKVVAKELLAHQLFKWIEQWKQQ
tara:strand:+ start:3389 stop:3661 length:273 start_codon:yes stop_codon:yes gene_type:complete